MQYRSRQLVRFSLPIQLVLAYDPRSCIHISDWIIGDNVLRSVYSVYDFGDFDSNGKMGNPYIKLLSLVDPNEASADFASARGSTARTNITYNAQGGTAAASTTVSLSDDITDTLKKVSVYFPAMLLL